MKLYYIISQFSAAIAIFLDFFPMIDVHCHLVDNKFKEDIDDVITRARDAGVTRAVVVPEFANQFEKVLELKRKYPDFVIAAVGVHPIQKRNRSVRMRDFEPLEGFLASHQDTIQCIGEVGLDFTVSQYKIGEEEKQVQEEVFRRQITLAKEFGLPLNVHSRTAAAATIDCLLRESASRAVLHAFDGTVEEARSAIAAGFYFSIPPSFSISKQRSSLIECVPIEQLLLETDSPVLGRVKGVRNEPSNCIVSAQFISQVKLISVEEVVRKTTENAEKLFDIRN